MTEQILASTFYEFLAYMAVHLEAQQESKEDCFAFCDDGKTLQISLSLREHLRLAGNWPELVERYEQLGGNVWCYDEPTEWEVA